MLISLFHYISFLQIQLLIFLLKQTFFSSYFKLSNFSIDNLIFVKCFLCGNSNEGMYFIALHCHSVAIALLFHCYCIVNVSFRIICISASLNPFCFLSTSSFFSSSSFFSVSWERNDDIDVSNFYYIARKTFFFFRVFSTNKLFLVPITDAYLLVFFTFTLLSSLASSFLHLIFFL